MLIHPMGSKYQKIDYSACRMKFATVKFRVNSRAAVRV